MELAKVFTNEGSQAVQLPKDCRFDDDEVLVSRIGDVVILLPKDDPWAGMRKGLDMFTDDFLSDGIDRPLTQKREDL